MVPEFLREPTRYTFFTGKGGVGKTSIACAFAVSLADQGRRVLLVSTDPASNLGQVFGAPIGPTIEPIAGVTGLRAVNIEPEAAASAYRERILAPMRRTSSRSTLPQLEEQLSGACTTEIAAFDEFTRLLTDASVMKGFDFVIFDTAPSGHTLRLLQLPAAWSTFIEDNPRGASCLGPLSGLQAQQAQYADTVERLRDPKATTVVLVARPDSGSLKEGARTSHELGALGIANQRVVINGSFSATDRNDEVALALEARGQRALAALPADLASLPRDVIALKPWNIVGVDALREFFDEATSPPAAERERSAPLPAETLRSLIDDVAAQDHGLIMVMGKGGVGKTTIAAAIAVELADRGHHVHLSTSDPAAHVEDVVHGDVPNLTVSRIDPAVETERYVERALATKGKNLDADARRVLEEDLRSPCTEEVAVFHAFSRIVSEARRGFVVLDTAPTGHTLLLLDTAGSYHREVLRTSAIPADRITTPLMRLQDPGYTRVILAALPETTPILEAAALQEDLRRAGVEPYAWVLNQSLGQTPVSDPVLQARARSEEPLITEVAATLAKRVVIVPVLATPPIGAGALRALSAEPVSA